MEKVKILYVISTLKNAGPVNVLFNIIKYLDYDYFEPIILTLSPEDKDSKYNDFIKLNVKVYSLNLSRRQLRSKYKRELTNKILKIDPAIIHTHGIRPDYLITKYLSNLQFKICSTIHNYPFQDYIMAYGNIVGYFIAIKHKKIIKKIQYPVSCSNTVSELLKSNHNIHTKVIQNGIDNIMYNTIKRIDKENLRKKLGLPTENTIFISTGLLLPRKEPINLINGFKNSNMSNKFKLIILGDGPLNDECHKLTDKNIIMLGKVDNVSDYLRASDIFISASKAEGLPMAVLEAMSTGLPVILSDIQPHKEIYNTNKNIGKIFKVGKVDELGKCISEIEDCDLDYMGMQARKTIEKHFSAEIMSNKYQELYKKICISTID